MLAPLLLAAALQAPADPPARPAPLPVTVRFDEAEYRPRDRQTVMTGKPRVTLTRGDVDLACKKLVADLDEKGKVKRAVCEGDVRLTRGDLQVTCASAVYEDEGARVTCSGDPTVRQGQSVTSGEQLTYELDADRITLTHGKGTLVPEPGQELPLPGGAGK